MYVVIGVYSELDDDVGDEKEDKEGGMIGEEDDDDESDVSSCNSAMIGD